MYPPALRVSRFILKSHLLLYAASLCRATGIYSEHIYCSIRVCIEILLLRTLPIYTLHVIYVGMDEKNNSSSYQQHHYTPEAKRDRFRRMAELRTNRILNDLRLLGNTGNKTLYQYEQSDVDLIFDTINKKITETQARFKTTKRDKPFRLGED